MLNHTFHIKPNPSFPSVIA